MESSEPVRVRDNNDGKDFEAIERDMTLEGYELEAVEIYHDGKQAFYVYVFRSRAGVDHK